MTPKRMQVIARLNRRDLIAGSAAVLAAGSMAHGAAAQGSTPVPAGDLEAFAALTERIVGSDGLDTALVEQSYRLITADGAAAEVLQGMMDAGDELDLDSLGEAEATVKRRILEFWYVGMVDGEPVDNREEFFSQLLAYGALSYFTVPAVCKSYGYWAEELDLPDRSA